MDKLKIAMAIATVAVVGLVCFNIGYNAAVKTTKTHNKAYQVYIYEDGSATIEVKDCNLISEGRSGLFISNGGY